MFSKILMFLGLGIVVSAVGLSEWSKASDDPFLQPGQEAIIGILGGIMAAIGFIGWMFRDISSDIQAAAKYAQTPEGKKAIKKGRRIRRLMDKQAKDPLNIRDE